MSVFSITITSALNNYKAILRKSLPAEKASAKISKLKLGRKHLQTSPDIELYSKATKVLDCVRKALDTQESSPVVYIGLEDFLHYLKDLMSEYHISDNRVIHGTQNASRAIVEVIQLVGLSPERLDGKVQSRLNQCVEEVARYGAEDQYVMLHKVLEKQLKTNIKLFEPLLLTLRRMGNDR